MPLGGMVNFYRMGLPQRVPVSPTSGATPVPVTLNAIQTGVPQLSFMFVNPNPFDVLLSGWDDASLFTPVTEATARWPILARTTAMGPFGSLRPVVYGACAWDNPGCPLPSVDFSKCFLWLIYGVGF